MASLTGLNYPEDPKVGVEVRILAQPGAAGTFVYRRKGSPNAVIDRGSALYKDLKVGSIVTGTVERVMPTSVLVSPTRIDDPVVLEGIRAGQSRTQPRPVGLPPGPDQGIILFHDSSPITADIRPGDLVSGPIIQEAETYVIIYPTDRVPPEPEHAPAPVPRPETFPPVHPFIPWILNELVPASYDRVRPEILGLVEATTPAQAFEELVTAAFRVLDIGDVDQHGWHKTGQNYPDGYIFAPNRKERDYIVVYDAKARSPPGYSHTVDDTRAFEDYLRSVPYFSAVHKRAVVVVSSEFARQPPSIRDGTLTFLPASVLAELVTLKVMNENLVTHDVVESLFFEGTIVESELFKHWRDHHALRDIRFGRA